ncbi:MAG: hypothetical protein GY809_26065, partial [Planctomycetes bacterium]|nr:hypothetical protein [Planctomycetota bacterium]
VYFYVRTDQALTLYTDPNWMLLFIDTDQNATTGWQGYDVRVNGGVTSAKTSLERWEAQAWTPCAHLAYRTEDKELEIAMSREQLRLGPGPVRVDFHWADNIQSHGDIETFSRHGDSAPNRRFNYRFIME